MDNIVRRIMEIAADRGILPPATRSQRLGNVQLIGIYTPVRRCPVSYTHLDVYKRQILYCACVCEDFTRENFERLKQRGIDTWAGTRFRTREMIEIAKECGATLITCDNPREVMQILRDMGLHR